MKKVTAIGIKKEGEPYRMENADAFKKQLNELSPHRYKHTVELYYNKSSHNQFGWLFSCVYPLSWIGLRDSGIDNLTCIEDVDHYWKELFANKEVTDIRTGELRTIPMTKAEFETIDMMVYCESIRKCCAEYLGCEIPDPDPDWKNKQDKLNNLKSKL